MNDRRDLAAARGGDFQSPKRSRKLATESHHHEKRLTGVRDLTEQTHHRTDVRQTGGFGLGVVGTRR
ncbi:hypothetical protein Pla100_37300 [Neorhodopirellula pilleata]|uniref:Uncharacterized protein n=1 Tax=Neorhodopirellula pilleata TaxID=2714738 RepID=A0A5C6A6S9_9BACT|nr:hypothetical protein Pla100_37300 [Neorhodopirellula pilleata]